MPHPDGMECVSCGGARFTRGRCDRCGRPAVDVEYSASVERAAVAVVAAAGNEFDVYDQAEAAGPLQLAIVRLAGTLKHWHYEGDGCLDTSP